MNDIYQSSIDEFNLAKLKIKRMIDRFKNGELSQEEQGYLAHMVTEEERELHWLKDHGQLLDEESLYEMIGRELRNEKEN